jgi:hypothetical protein
MHKQKIADFRFADCALGKSLPLLEGQLLIRAMQAMDDLIKPGIHAGLTRHEY